MAGRVAVLLPFVWAGLIEYCRTFAEVTPFQERVAETILLFSFIPPIELVEGTVSTNSAESMGVTHRTAGG